MQKIQAQLNLAGHDAGPEDGAWGRSTVNALKAWQEAQGLAPTAVVDDLPDGVVMDGKISAPAMPVSPPRCGLDGRGRPSLH